MDRNNSIQLFEDRKIRTAWDEEQCKCYYGNALKFRYQNVGI